MTKYYIELTELEKKRLIKAIKDSKGSIIIENQIYPLIGHRLVVIDSADNIYEITEL